MARTTKGRRAADTKVKTPLTELTDALNANAGMIGRRAAVVAASGGLLVGLGLPAASSNDAQVQTDTSNADAPDYVANGAVTVEKSSEKKDDISIAGSNGFEASKAPEPKPTETEAPSPSSSSSGESSSSDSPAEDSGDSNKSSGSKDAKESGSSGGSGDYPDSPSGSIADIAKQYAGVPYVWGGTSPSGWDCSGFTSYVYKKAGKSIPRTSAAQRGGGTQIPQSEAKPGDLVYAATPRSHIGVYLGGDKMIDAGNERVGTSIRSFKWMGKVTFVRY